jgi:hypothetical protein
MSNAILDSVEAAIRARSRSLYRDLMQAMETGRSPAAPVQAFVNDTEDRIAAALAMATGSDWSSKRTRMLRVAVSDVRLGGLMDSYGADAVRSASDAAALQAKANKWLMATLIDIHDGRATVAELMSGAKAAKLRQYLFADAATARQARLMGEYAERRAAGAGASRIPKAARAKFVSDVEATITGPMAQRRISAEVRVITERLRSSINRVAQTEGHRAIIAMQSSDIDRTGVRWVQVVLSPTHPRPDICDLITGQDAWGKGSGVYRFDKLPAPPYHPHCRCSLVPRPDLTGEGRLDKGAAKEFLSGFPPDERGPIMGSKEMATAVMQGADWRRIKGL